MNSTYGDTSVGKAESLESSIFNWLVRDHVERDWQAAARHIVDGEMYVGESHINPGFTENKNYTGLLLLQQNGINPQTLLEKRMAANRNIVHSGVVDSYEAFRQYRSQHGARDGAHVLDGLSGNVFRVPVLINSAGDFSMDALAVLPGDFCALDTTIPMDGAQPEPGNRTYVGVAFPQWFPNTTTYMIRQTAYTKLGMGKVVQLDDKGVVQEFFLANQPRHRGDFIDAKRKVVGVHRVYDRSPDAQILSRTERLVGQQEYATVGLEQVFAHSTY